MRTFILDIIPRLQRFSKKLDSISALTNKHWVLLSDESGKKVVYIFREKDNQLLIAENGRIKKGNWEYLGSNSLVLDIDSESYLFKHGFLDDQVLALKIDGTEEYALLVNENHFDAFLNSLQRVNSFLEDTYLKQTQQVSTSTPPKQISSFNISADQQFNPDDFPSMKVELEALKKKLQEYPKQHSVDIIVSFAKEHSLKNEWFKSNEQLSNDIARQELKIKEIERLFNLSRTNNEFQNQLQDYLRSELQ